jgi:hypothetical protein
MTRLTHNLTSRELATVLAALRLFQKERGGFNRPEWFPHFEDVKPLTDLLIDDLCERLNCGGTHGQ